MSARKSVAGSIRWVASSQAVRYGLRLLSIVVLARLLDPGDFGIMAMVITVTGALVLLGDLGISAAIIRMPTLSDEFVSSAFWINCSVGLLCALTVCLFAGEVASFYREPLVAPLLQVVSVTLFLTGAYLTQRALLERQRRFKEIAIIEALSTIISVGFAILVGILDGGVWALVTQAVTAQLVNLLGFWFCTKWKPAFLLRLSEVRPVIGFSLNLTGFSIANYLRRQADNLLIGRFLGAESLGQYNLALQIMSLPLQNVSHLVGRVLYPTISQSLNDTEKMRRIYLDAAHAVALVTFPVMLGLWAIAEPAVVVVLGDKWRPSIDLLFYLAPIGATQSVVSLNGTIYKATGRTGTQLIWALVVSTLYLTGFAIGLQWGVVGVAAAFAVVHLAVIVPSLTLALRPISCGPTDTLRAISRPLIASVIMAAIVKLCLIVLLAKYSHVIQIAAGALLGIALYGTQIWVLDGKRVFELIRLLLGRTSVPASKPTGGNLAE